MGKIKEIMESDHKLKEKITLLSEDINKDNNLIRELFDCFKTGSDVEKGTCAHVMKIVSKEKPELFKPYIFNQINIFLKEFFYNFRNSSQSFVVFYYFFIGNYFSNFCD